MCPKRDDKPFVFRNVIVYSSPLKGSSLYAASVERSLSQRKKKNSLSPSFSIFKRSFFVSLLISLFIARHARCEIEREAGRGEITIVNLAGEVVTVLKDVDPTIGVLKVKSLILVL